MVGGFEESSDEVRWDGDVGAAELGHGHDFGGSEVAVFVKGETCILVCNSFFLLVVLGWMGGNYLAMIMMGCSLPVSRYCLANASRMWITRGDMGCYFDS